VNEHPEELLADYVERTLGADDRARVEDHLASCERCRDEVQLAGQARAALLSLPELEEVRGIPLAVRRRTRSAPTQTQSRTLRVVGTAAVAAAVVAGGIFVVSNLGSSDSSQSALPGSGAPERAEEEGGGAGGESDGVTSAQDQSGEAPAPSFALAGPPVLPIYRETEREYDASSLAPFARKLRDDAQLAIDSGLAPNATDFFSNFDPEAFGPTVRLAIGCVLADLPPNQLVVPYKIEAASFEGTPAYVAAFLQGPTPDDSYDRIVIWVVDREGCALLSLASQLL
jgi:hypothetical protein